MPVYTRRQQAFARAKGELQIAALVWKAENGMTTPETISALLDLAMWLNAKNVRSAQARVTAKASREGEEGGSGE